MPPPPVLPTHTARNCFALPQPKEAKLLAQEGQWAGSVVTLQAGSSQLPSSVPEPGQLGLQH